LPCVAGVPGDWIHKPLRDKERATESLTTARRDRMIAPLTIGLILIVNGAVTGPPDGRGITSATVFVVSGFIVGASSVYDALFYRCRAWTASRGGLGRLPAYARHWTLRLGRSGRGRLRGSTRLGREVVDRLGDDRCSDAGQEDDTYGA
jgi:hypothetical protein